MREGLIVQIAKALPSDVSIIHSANRSRSRLHLSNGLIVCVLVARSVRVGKQNPRWQVYPVRRERKFTTLLARLNATNSSILDIFIFPDIDREDRFEIGLNHPWLNRGRRLRHLSQFCEVVAQLQRARSPKRP